MNDAVVPKSFLNSDLSDLKIRVQLEDDRSMVFPGHKLIMRAASKVFSVMFENGKFKEEATSVMEIQVPGDEDLAIKFLRYLYTKELDDLDLDHYILLAKVAHMYEVANLHGICEEKLLLKISPYSVCRAYASLEKYATEKFKFKCLEFMLAFAFLIFEKDLHLLLPEEMMKSLLQSEMLNVLDEDQALKALLRWGHTRCALNDTENRNHFVSGLLPFINWNDIKDEEYSDFVRDYKSETKVYVIHQNRAQDPSLNTFAYFWNFRKASVVTSMFTANCVEENELIKFSVVSNILLTGLVYYISFNGTEDWKSYTTLSVDNVNLNETTFSDITLLAKHNPYSLYRAKLELRTPLLLNCTEIHSIKMKVSSGMQSRFCLPNYPTEESLKGSCSDSLVMHLHKTPVLALSKLYYYV